jgi:hypothetical protein
MGTHEPSSPAVDGAYCARVEAERRVYRSCEVVHDLPPIFHYWSNRYLRPRFEAFGFSTPDQKFEDILLASVTTAGAGRRRFLSIGSGNCDLEVRLASSLKGAGHYNFVIDCLDINEDMLERVDRRLGRLACLTRSTQ